MKNLAKSFVSRAIACVGAGQPVFAAPADSEGSFRIETCNIGVYKPIRRRVMRDISSILVASSLVVSQAWSQQPGNLPPTSSSAGASLKIEVIEGDAGANALKEKMAVAPVVEVRDGWDLPIAGAQVTFALPHGRPGATFADGSKVLSGTTDGRGRVTAAGLRPVGKGAFKIDVRASYRGSTAAAVLTQTNFANLAAARKVNLPPMAMSLSGGQKALLLAGLAAGAGVGVAMAMDKKSSGPSASNCTSQFNTFESDINTAVALPVGSTQWVVASQTMFNALGSYCTCAGGAGELGSNSTLLTDLNNLINAGRNDGFVVPSACGPL